MLEHQIRVVLEWALQPEDLDLHCFVLSADEQGISDPEAPAIEHVYWKHNTTGVGGGVVLDTDDKDGEGPETLTNKDVLANRQYVFAARVYPSMKVEFEPKMASNSAYDCFNNDEVIEGYPSSEPPFTHCLWDTEKIADSEARVRVWSKDKLLREFQVPTFGVGQWWVVFSYTRQRGVQSIDRLVESFNNTALTPRELLNRGNNALPSTVPEERPTKTSDPGVALHTRNDSKSSDAVLTAFTLTEPFSSALLSSDVAGAKIACKELATAVDQLTWSSYSENWRLLREIILKWGLAKVEVRRLDIELAVGLRHPAPAATLFGLLLAVIFAAYLYPRVNEFGEKVISRNGRPQSLSPSRTYRAVCVSLAERRFGFIFSLVGIVVLTLVLVHDLRQMTTHFSLLGECSRDCLSRLQIMEHKFEVQSDALVPQHADMKKNLNKLLKDLQAKAAADDLSVRIWLWKGGPWIAADKLWAKLLHLPYTVFQKMLRSVAGF